MACLMLRFHLEPATERRFWAKIDCHGPDECWPWVGARDDWKWKA